MKPDIAFTRAKELELEPCKLETPATIHNTSEEELVPMLVGMKASPLMEITWKIQQLEETEKEV